MHSHAAVRAVLPHERECRRAADAQARKTVAEFVTSAGLHPIDVGPLRRARALEAFQIVHISLQREMAHPFHSAIEILT